MTRNELSVGGKTVKDIVRTHRYVLRHISTIKSDLDRLELEVRKLEAAALTGRPQTSIERDYRDMCDEIEFQMPLVKDDINELLVYHQELKDQK